MKKIITLTLITLMINHAGFAKIWRVNNNPGVTADFTSAQQAHDAAAVQGGDTLYFEHSVLSYGGLQMSKTLALIGTGSFLPYNAGLQYIAQSSYLEDITITPTASYSTISVNCRNIVDSADNLKITRCKTVNITFMAADNCTVSNSFVDGTIMFTQIVLFSPCRFFSCQNMALYNNIVNGSIDMGLRFFAICGSFYQTPHSVTAFNNSIQGYMRITGFAYNNLCNNIQTDNSTVISNNICYAPQAQSTRTTSSPDGTSTTATIETGNNNQFSISQASLFAPSFQANIDTSWRLNPTSLALGAGTSGEDCGSTGGGNPYLFGTQPAIPTIYKLNVAPAPTGNSIGVTISTRSNN